MQCADTVILQEDCTSAADVYSVRTLEAFLHRVVNVWHHDGTHRFNKKEWLQLPCTLDIKTSSFLHHGIKCGCMYYWSICCNGALIAGRSWEALRKVLHEMHRFFDTGAERKMVIYVHDLAFFFQFFRKWVKWSEVFAFKAFTPASAEIENYGIIFKCSKFLSGMNWAEIGNNTKLKVIDLKDDKQLRTPNTVLTEFEVRAENTKVYALCVYIAQCIDAQKGVEKMPVTKIGYIRRGCRDTALMHKHVQNDRKRMREMWAYRSIMKALTLDTDEYMLLKAAFRGGDMRANVDYIGEKLYDITSKDISSSYAACIICDYFPMSRGRMEDITTEEELQPLAEKYCVVCDLLFKDIRPKFGWEYYLPKSRCSDVVNCVTQQGRIVAAEQLRTQMTEIDYNLMRKLYTWKECIVLRCYTYERGRLPSEFCRYIAELYQKKTQLKGIKGREREYIRVKEDLCSLYGMMVMAIDHDIFEYDSESGRWEDPKKPDIAEAIDAENKRFARFTFYAWGVYVAAHARRRLWNAIINLKDDYVYCHTDSVKLRHMQNHGGYFLEYNRIMREQLRKASFYHDIPMQMLCPKNIEGKEKPLGFWETDAQYFEFKTSGAGRYFVLNAETKKYELCVSGLAPDLAGEYIGKVFKKNPMTSFRKGLRIPAEYSGRVVHYYIDSGYTAYVKDYKGRVGRIKEKSCIHLCPVPYRMTEGAEFFDFLQLLGEPDFEGGEKF